MVEESHVSFPSATGNSVTLLMLFSPSPGKGAFQVRLILPLGSLNEEDTGAEPLLVYKGVWLKGVVFYHQQGCYDATESREKEIHRNLDVNTFMRLQGQGS